MPKQKGAANSTTQNLTRHVQQGLKQIFMMPTQTVPESDVDRHAATSTPVATQTRTLPKSTSSSEIAVVFSKSRHEVACDGEEPILNLAEREGIKIRSNCRSGVCGSCKKRKLQGSVRVEGEPEGLDEIERQEGYILTCISYPTSRVVIDA